MTFKTFINNSELIQLALIAPNNPDNPISLDNLFVTNLRVNGYLL